MAESQKDRRSRLRKAQDRVTDFFENRRTTRGGAQTAAQREANLRATQGASAKNPQAVPNVRTDPTRPVTGLQQARTVGPNPAYPNEGNPVQQGRRGRFEGVEQRRQNVQNTAPRTQGPQPERGPLETEVRNNRTGQVTTEQMERGSNRRISPDEQRSMNRARRTRQIQAARSLAKNKGIDTKNWGLRQWARFTNALESGIAIEKAAATAARNTGAAKAGAARGAIEADTLFGSDEIDAKINDLDADDGLRRNNRPDTDNVTRVNEANPPPRSDADIDANQPKAERTFRQRARDGFDSFKSRFTGSTTPDVGPPQLTRRQRLGRGLKAGAKTGGKAVGLDAAFELGNYVAQDGVAQGTYNAVTDLVGGIQNMYGQIRDGNVGQVVEDIGIGILETPARILSNAATSTAGLIASGAEFFGANPESVQSYRQLVEDINDPNYSGPNTLVGILSGLKNGTLRDADRVLDSLDRLMEYDPEGVQRQIAVENEVANQIAGQGGGDGSIAPEQTVSQGYVPPGLRQTRSQITPEQFAANNENTGSIARGLAPGTGFMQSSGPDGQFATFIDGRGQPAPQQTGLRAANNEIVGRDPLEGYSGLARFAGINAEAGAEFARQSAAAEANAANVEALTKAETATRNRQATEASSIWDMLSNPETRSAGVQRAASQLEQAIATGDYDPRNPVIVAANQAIVAELEQALEPGVFGALWNSIAPSFAGGGGRGLMDFLNGDAVFNGQEIYSQAFIDDEGDVRIASSDPKVDGLDIGNELPPSILRILRQNLRQQRPRLANAAQ